MSQQTSHPGAGHQLRPADLQQQLEETNIKPEHIDAWLNPDGDLAAMQAIFDDKLHPYYDHREAA